MSPRWPGTHAGSSPEGDAAFDEEHPQVAAADHEQHAAETQVDEANEDLDALRERGTAQPGWRVGATPPPAGRGGNSPPLGNKLDSALLRRHPHSNRERLF